MTHHRTRPGAAPYTFIEDGKDGTGGAPARPRVAMVVHALGQGGGERVLARLAAALARSGVSVAVLARNPDGAARAELPPGTAVVRLERGATALATRARVVATDPWPLRRLIADNFLDAHVRYLPGVAAFVGDHRPDALLGFGLFSNLLAVWGRRLSGVPARVVVSEHVPLSQVLADHADRAPPRRKERWRRRAAHLPAVLRQAYGRADRVVAVSGGVADDLARFTGLSRARIQVVNNPVVDDDLASLVAQRPDHPWFAPGQPPPLLAIGRLTVQKDFATLLDAFARVPQTLAPRLVILGEGTERAALEARVRSLGLGDRVALPGHVANPLACLARARLLVCSSRFEGAPLVLIEALACGCPVVSTDCPHGPREILDGGRLGALVPVGDAAALAQAIVRALQQPADGSALRARAQDFSVMACARAYAALLCPDHAMADG